MVHIELAGLKFFAHHGVYDYERENGSWFKVDISFNCLATGAIAQDELEGTVNYEEVYRIVSEEMKVPSKLIEHVAARIHNRIINDMKGISKLTTKLYKLEAPLGGPLDHVSVTLQQ